MGGTRYSTLPDPPRPHHPGYTSPTASWPAARPACCTRTAARLKQAVGLKSVDQLTLSTKISGFRGMTEVYNLRVAGNPNNHFLITGTD